MTTLSQDKKNLLNKLYNLKGEDNVIIKEISENIDETTNLIKETTDQRVDNEAKKIDTEGKLSLFESQKDTFSSAFNGLDNDTFDALRGIGINIEIGTMLDTIEKKSPDYIKQLNEEISDYADKIDSNNQKIEELSEKLNSLRSEKSHNEDSRDKLNSLLNQSLSPDEAERESLTTSYVKKVLSLFEIFNTSEISSLTKIIIFPDEGLYEYIDILDGKEPVLEDEEEKVELEEVSEPQINEEVKTEENAEPVNKTTENSDSITNLLEEISKEINESEDENDDDTETEDSNEDTSNTAADIEEVSKEDSEANKENRSEDTYIPIADENTNDKTLDIYQDIADKEDLDSSLNLFEDLEKTTMMSLNSPSDEKDELPEEETQEEEINESEEVEEPENEAEESKTDIEDSEAKQNNDKFNNEELSNIETFIEEQGLSVDMFSDINNEPTSTILKSFAKSELETVKENYEILRSLNTSEQAVYKFIDDYSYLTDADFNKKVTLLRIKNISERKIKDLLEDNNEGLRVDIKTFEDRIKALEDFNPITDENISSIADDVLKFKENYNEFVQNGFELEEKEVRNYEKVILESPNIRENMLILKNYLISIIRKNGKYALSVFWKKPYELLTDIDDLIEADLEELITTHPEILAEKNTEVLKRVKYCEDNVIPLLESNDETSFCDYVYNYLKFAERFEDELPSLVEHSSTNDILRDQLNEDLVNALDEYYKTTEVFDIVNLDEQNKVKFENLNNQIVDKLNANSPTKYVYKLGNLYISKNKYERNLSVLINSLSNIPSNIDDKTIILVAALYNSRHSAKSINNLIGDVISGNISAGGNEE